MPTIGQVMQGTSEAAGRVRALVTGAGGLVGRALLAELHASGKYQVTGLTRAEADLRDPAQALSVIAAAEPEIVYHLAARVHGVMGNALAQADCFLDNIRINTNVVEAARCAGARKVVAMGSAAVYSDAADLPMREDQVWHGAPHGSEAAYAHAKRAMLAHLGACGDQYGLDYTFLIPTNLFGPHDRFDEEGGHVIPSLLSKFERALRTGCPVEIWGSGRPRRDFMYVADAARAILLAGERVSGPINIATGRTVSIADLAAVLVGVTGFTGPLRWDRSKPDGQMQRDYDVSRLSGLGFRPKHDLADALGETFTWLQRNWTGARR